MGYLHLRPKRSRWSWDLADSIFSGSNNAKDYAPSALAFEIRIEYRERVLFWMTVTRGHGAMDLGDPIYSGSKSAKSYAPSALAYEI